MTATIPASPDAEAAVLGSLILDSNGMDDIPTLTASDFYAERNGRIFQVISDLRAAGSIVDYVTLVDKLESLHLLTVCGGASYITQLTNAVPSAVYIGHYGGIVERYARRRKLIAPATSIASMAYDTAQDDAELTIHDLLDYTTDKVTEIKAGVTYAHRIAQGCEELIKHLEELHAQILKLQVPGSLPGDLRDLMEQTGSVRAYAKTLAERLRAAAERLQSAGAKAKEQHMPLADAVRDMGHDRPAEREYHDE